MTPVRFGYGSCMGLLAVPVLGSDSSPLRRGFLSASILLLRFWWFLKNGSDGSASSAVSGKTVPMIEPRVVWKGVVLCGCRQGRVLECPHPRKHVKINQYKSITAKRIVVSLFVYVCVCVCKCPPLPDHPFRVSVSGACLQAAFTTAVNDQGRLSFRSQSVFELLASSSQPNPRPNSCLAIVPPLEICKLRDRFSKRPRNKNKTTNPFGQTTKNCLSATGATLQECKSESSNYKLTFSHHERRS